MLDLATLKLQDFTPHTGSTFELTVDDDLSVSLKLVEIEPRGQAPGPGADDRQGFSLLFAARPDATAVPQRLYRLEHASLGSLELFLVPIGQENGGMRYEAVFN